MSQLGIGAMISHLAGDASSVDAYNEMLDKRVKSFAVSAEANSGDGALLVELDDGSKFSVYDGARSCCESRYMTTDDDLAHYAGSKIKEIELRTGPGGEGGYDVHEELFVLVKTTKGHFTLVTHNYHNGYYGGISIRVAKEKS